MVLGRVCNIHSSSLGSISRLILTSQVYVASGSWGIYGLQLLTKPHR